MKRIWTTDCTNDTDRLRNRGFVFYLGFDVLPLRGIGNEQLQNLLLRVKRFLEHSYTNGEQYVCVALRIASLHR